jgi:hypothetical protein
MNVDVRAAFTIAGVVLAVLALVVAVIALLFGPAIALRLAAWRKGRREARSTREDALRGYLSDARIFLRGLPLFIEHTWDWGPSVPNYGTAFPENPFPTDETLRHLGALVTEAVTLYGEHSTSGGRARDTLDEAISEAAGLERTFIAALDVFARSEWPGGRCWTRIAKEIRRLDLPSRDRQRIQNLRSQRGPAN